MKCNFRQNDNCLLMQGLSGGHLECSNEENCILHKIYEEVKKI